LQDHLGEILPLWSILPFLGMLFSIALFPLIAPKFWHRHFGKVSAFWSFTIVIPLLILYRSVALYEFLHLILADYVPFVILLTSLYTVSGNILLSGNLRGTPIMNTVLLIVGTILASWMGTTGAAMLLIRPFLRANRYRRNRTFMVVFFIFLVANIGGSLTPLGDPPLFLGFLRGVPFFWTFKLFPQMLMVAFMLLVIYFFIDSYYYRKEGKPLPEEGTNDLIKIQGAHNIFFLIGIVGAVLFSGVIHMKEINILEIHRPLQDLIRDVILILFAFFSIATTKREIREENEFTWFPMKEVAILFIGIFITMMPCLRILQAGSYGKLAFIITSVKDPYHYFWITGILSSFLDNAPTYLTFLSSLVGRFYPGIDPREAVSMLIDQRSIFLEAISAGAVFFGANTYIGNAPNFMVRSIAEEMGTSMPTFLGYMLKYSIPILIPLFIGITIIFYL